MNAYSIIHGGKDSPTPTQGERQVISLSGEVIGDRLVITGRKHPENPTFGGNSEDYGLVVIPKNCSTGIPKGRLPTSVVRGPTGVGTNQIKFNIPVPNPIIGPFFYSYWIVRDTMDQEGYNPHDPAHPIWFWGGPVVLQVTPE